jgi:hypothetical protein
MMGPVYFKIMMETILASSPESLHDLTTLIQTTTLKDFYGKNVIEFMSFASGALEQLRNNSALPVDILLIMANALKQCETLDFVSYITTMYNNHVQHVKVCTVSDMLSSAKEEYIALVSAKKWTVGLTDPEQNSAFFAGTCSACGVKGHTSNDPKCPLYQAGAPGRSQGGRGGR